MPVKINTKSVLLYTAYTAALILLNKTVDGVPLTIGLYFAMLLCGTNIFLTPALYMLGAIIHLRLITCLLSIFEGAFLCVITFIYRRCGKKIHIEAVVYILIALAPYIAFAPVGAVDLIQNEYILKGIASAGAALFTYFCFKTVYALIYRTMRCRLKEDELLCCTVTFAAVGTGFYNIAGVHAYTAFAAGAIVLCARLLRNPSAIIVALILAFPPAISAFSLTPVTVYVIGASASLLFSGAGRASSGLITGALASAYLYFTGGFDCPPLIIAVRVLIILCFIIPPSIPSDKYMRAVKDRLTVTQVLSDTAVERSRRRTGDKLYRISEVFREIECAFKALDENIDDGAVRARMLSELKEKCCKNCERAKKCANTKVYSGFAKLIDAGCVKGKVNLIDLPSEITLNCTAPAEVLARLNVLLAEYRRYMTEAENACSGRALLAEQARGVADVMKSCAVDLCTAPGEDNRMSANIITALSTRGISCPELFVNGDGEVCAVVCGKADADCVCEVISLTLKRKYALKDVICYDSEKRCYIFGAPPRLDAAFGVAYEIKNGEKVSGDTHTVIRINEHSFLMALSDGMGSGEYARKVSATAISLIEAFYRAEMPEGTVLKTINKLLSFNRDERFTCIDIAAVNLESGIADFVKIGSPAGVIIREGEIKILESASLPLGILDNLKPTVCSEQLKNGDIVVFMSDGITSAFPSSTELYEFMRELKPLNPQNLADKILAGAKARTKKTADDMTVLCTRIFEK